MDALLKPRSYACISTSSLHGWEIQKRRASHWNVWKREGDRELFLKWYFHGPLRNPARRELENAHRIAALGIPTVVPLAWGRHSLGSYLVLEGSPGPSGEAWGRGGAPDSAMRTVAAELARLVARMHGAGLCHRDLNVYHVLVDDGRVRLIDVGRVRRFWLLRWIVKDLASLLASARAEGFPNTILRAFLRAYLATSALSWRRKSLLRRVTRKADRYRRHNEKAADQRRRTTGSSRFSTGQ